ncbi:MAG: hypothetical protein HQK52_00060 [Oligoflexia bacterium]|nr:hypothetical protein [Oligoflexia bacterium]
MENVLFVCMNTVQDLLDITHLVCSTRGKLPQANICVLTLKEHASLVKKVKGLNRIFQVDRKRISKIHRVQSISNVFAVNYWFGVIKEVREIAWDLVYVANKDICGQLVASSLNAKKIAGSYYLNSSMIPAYSCSWGMLSTLKDEEIAPSVFNLIELQHKIAAMEFCVGEDLKINLDLESNKNACEQLVAYRQSIRRDKRNSKLVAVDLNKFTEENDVFSKKSVCELLKKLINNELFHPILLISGSDDEKDFVNYLNKQCNYPLLTICANLLNVSSVLINVEILVTGDVLAVKMADILNVPVVMISDDANNVYDNGGVNSGSIMIAPIVEKCAGDIVASGVVVAEDVLFAIYDIAHEIQLSEQTKVSADVAVYRTEVDATGIWYRPIAGEINIHNEISKMFTRYFLIKIIDGVSNNAIMEHITREFDKREIHSWVDSEKELLMYLANLLIETIKSLRNIGKGKNNLFVSNLQMLLDGGKSSKLLSSLHHILKLQLESIPNDRSLGENIKGVDVILHEYKQKLQILVSSLTELSYSEYKKRNEVSL